MTSEEFYKLYANTPIELRKSYIKYGHRRISLRQLYKKVERDNNIIRSKQFRQKDFIKMAEEFWKSLNPPTLK